MSWFRALLPACLLVVVPSTSKAAEGAADAASALQEKVQRAIERAESSVGCILVSRSDEYRQFGAAPSDPSSGKLGRFDSQPALRNFGGTERRRANVLALDLSHADHVPESFGSGVVIDASGLVLTAAHVVHNANKIFVRLPGGRGSWADIHALDPRSDLAVLRLLDPAPDLKPIAFGDGGTVRKGQFVISVANPFAAGFRDGSPSASWGIISNIRRRAPGSPSETDRSRKTLHQFGTLLQTDVRLNQGCSGGALLNLEGELIGLTTATAALQGGETPGGFAIPMDTNLRRIIEVLRRGEEVEYGFLGVELKPDGRGVFLKSVALNSPAQRGGLQSEDQILTINGVPVRDLDDLFLQIGINLAGSTVRIEATRPGGTRRFCTVKLAKYLVNSTPIASRKPPARGGLRVDYASVLSQRPGMIIWHGIPQGVVIREVLPGSPADAAQLQPDKVITHVNDKPVASPADYYTAMKLAGDQVELRIRNPSDREDRVTLAIK